MGRDTGVVTESPEAALGGEMLDRLVADACKLARWAPDQSTPASERLRRSVAAMHVRVEVANRVEIDISWRIDPALVVRARVATTWTEQVHDHLFRELQQGRGCKSLAHLGLVHWVEISRACARAAAAWETSTVSSCEELLIPL